MGKALAYGLSVPARYLRKLDGELCVFEIDGTKAVGKIRVYNNAVYLQSERNLLENYTNIKVDYIPSFMIISKFTKGIDNIVLSFKGLKITDIDNLPKEYTNNIGVGCGSYFENLYGKEKFDAPMEELPWDYIAELRRQRENEDRKMDKIMSDTLKYNFDGLNEYIKTDEAQEEDELFKVSFYPIKYI